MGQYDNRFGNSTIGITNFSLTPISLTAANSPLQLYWPDQSVDGSIANPTTASSWNDMTSDQNGRVIKLPNATLQSPGQIMDFNNYGNFIINISYQDGTLLNPLPAMQLVRLVLIDNTTANGLWRVAPVTGLATAVTQITQASSTGNIVIIPGGPQTGSVAFSYSLALDLGALTSFDTPPGSPTGIAARTAVNTWSLRTITGFNNQIVVTNGAGIAGNPTIALASTITGIANLTVGNLNLAGNTISSLDANGNINFVPQGTGVSTFATNVKLLTAANLYFRNPANTFDTILTAGAQTANVTYTWPTGLPAANQALVARTFNVGTNVAQLEWTTVSTSTGGGSTPHAIARYFDGTGTLENSGVLLDDANNVTGMVSLVVGNIQLGLGTNTNISTVSGNILLSPNGSSETYSSNNLSLRTSSLLKLFNTANNNFISIGAFGSNAVTYDLAMPTTIPALTQQLTISQLGTTPTQNRLIWRDSVPGRNILVNGAMDIWQRNTTFVAGNTFFKNNDNSVTADRWKLLSDGSPTPIVQVDRVDGFNIPSYGSCLFSLRASILVANTKFGFGQILEAADTEKLINQPISFGVVLAGQAPITSLSFALLAWTGTADAPSGDFVLAWNGSNVEPTWQAGWSRVAIQTFTISAAASLYMVNNLSMTNTSINNCAVFVWANDTTQLNGGNTIHMSMVKLEAGQFITPYELRTFNDELIASKRWFNKDFTYDIAVGTANTATVASNHIAADPIADTFFYAEEEFEVEMARQPTFVTYPIVTPTNTTAWSHQTGPSTFVDFNAGSATAIVDKKAYKIQNVTGGGLTPINQGQIVGHWYADSEFY